MTKLFQAFFTSEKAAGLVLVFCTVLSLVLANSAFGAVYTRLWHFNLGAKPVEFWINDGLMTIFFLLAGLEIKRELYVGELASFQKALLPLLAAAGGMALPALVHFAFNHGTATQQGVGIPMATDIAFSLGVLSLVGARVPASLKVFLTALAIIDDLGAILVIAFFYSATISLGYLGLAALPLAVLLLLNKLKWYRAWVVAGLGGILWFLVYRSGIHPTITGVVVAFAIPFGTGDADSPAYSWQHRLHNVVAYAILPLFALANTVIILPASLAAGLLTANGLGISLGLLVGKPVGILSCSLLGVASGWCVLPPGVTGKQLVGAALLAGIGFTMSIFIALLAFGEATTGENSKIAVIAASTLAALLGYCWLRLTLPPAAAARDA